MLRASGIGFPARNFLAAHLLPSEACWDDAFNSLVSEADGDDLAGQVQDALAYLKRHRPALQALTATPGVTATLDFGLWQSDGASQSVVLPVELVRAAGLLGLGLGVSVYAVAP
jgi:hypothetical protein